MKGMQLTDYEPDIAIQRDEYGHITSGLVVGDILRQNQALILILNKGELKECPAVGVGINDMLLDNDPIYWRTEIKEQLEMDHQVVNSVTVTQTGIQIDAKY